MEKVKEWLWTAGIIMFAVVLYFIWPAVISAFADGKSQGTAGIAILAAVCLAVIGIFYYFGCRGRELLTVALLVLFIAAMIWLYFNYRDLDIMISSRYGQGAANLVFLVLIILIGLISMFLL